MVQEAKLLIMRQAIKWYAYCVDKLKHVITEPKKQISAN